VIPRSLLAPFLYSPRVVSEDELERAPYIVSSLGGHLISATGNTVYARNVTSKTIPIYDVVKPGIVYKDPDSGEILGLWPGHEGRAGPARRRLRAQPLMATGRAVRPAVSCRR